MASIALARVRVEGRSRVTTRRRPSQLSFRVPPVRPSVVKHGSVPRFKNAPRAAETMGVPLYPEDLLQQCAPWGNVCVVAGTHYIPIALPSIIGSLFLFAPLVYVFLKLQSAEAQLVLRDEEIVDLKKKIV